MRYIWAAVLSIGAGQKTKTYKLNIIWPIDGIYKHTENYGDYVILTIWTQGVEKDATVTIPDGLIPDYTDAALNGKSANVSFSVNLKENQSVSYRFFTTGTYNKAPIKVTSGDVLPETPLS